jgi:hypothetical protein
MDSEEVIGLLLFGSFGCFAIFMVYAAAVHWWRRQRFAVIAQAGCGARQLIRQNSTTEPNRLHYESLIVLVLVIIVGILRTLARLPHHVLVVICIRITGVVLRVGNAALVERLRITVRAIGFIIDAFFLSPFISGWMPRTIDGAIKATKGAILGACRLCEANGAKDRQSNDERTHNRLLYSG